MSDSKSPMCELVTVDTATHTITNGKNEIQFTQFEDNHEKMIRIETKEPIIIPFTMLQEYMDITDNKKSIYASLEDLQRISAWLMIIYLLTILGVGVWTFTLYKNVLKMNL